MHYINGNTLGKRKSDQ